MSPRDLCLLLAMIAFSSRVVAADSGQKESSQRGGIFHHDAALRDGESDSSIFLPPVRVAFPLPPGGHEFELQPTASTPYDRYFGSVRAVIASMDAHTATMAKACHLMKVGHSFEYKTRDPYRPDPPRLTELQHSGDCKSKALWLFDALSDGAALFVIGKAEKNLRTSHAWVYWRCDGRWWVLDCTDRLDPIAADTISPDRYIPYYSFGKFGSYCHPAAKVVHVKSDASERFSGGAPIAGQRGSE